MSDHRFCGWIAQCNRSGNVAIRSTPDDTPDTMKLAARLLHEVGTLQQQRAVTAAPPVDTTTIELSAVSESAPIAVAGIALTGKGASWLSDAIEAWHQHKVRSGAWTTDETWTNANGPDLRLFRELISERQHVHEGKAEAIWDMRVGEIDAAHVVRAVELMCSYPKQQGKREGGDAKAILRRGGKPQSRTTVDKKLGRVNDFLRWGYTSKYLKDNLTADLTLAAQRFGGVQDEGSGYRALSREETQAIFESQAYREDSFEHAWQYWSPLIAVHSGVRVRELADLKVDDIDEERGVHFMRIRGDHRTHSGTGPTSSNRKKRVKTRAANRRIPVAQTLIDLGFLDYVRAQRTKGSDWLWDNLRWEAKSGHGRPITEWFGDYLKVLGIKQTDTVFHSFRSNFQQAMLATGIDSKVLDTVSGHAGQSTREKHYMRTADGCRFVPLELVKAKLDEMVLHVSFFPSRRWGSPPSASSSSGRPGESVTGDTSQSPTVGRVGE